MSARGYRRLGWVGLGFITAAFLLFLTLAGVVSSQPASGVEANRSLLFAMRQESKAASATEAEQPVLPQAPLTQSEVRSQSPDLDLQLALVGPDLIENCDRVTYTLFITNSDTITATNVRVTDTMPSGFSPTSYSVNLGTLPPGQSTSRAFVFDATCSAPSGQNQATVTDDQGDLFIRYKDFTVLPGAITVRKEPSVIRARVGEVVTWTVYVENTG
ncbi:MAG: DUF11 domain-containing protein, partial [Chloroflexi bacterium]|nr:DUF11 domain-containing protein [Chloroflexota bacterium]